MSVEQKKNVDVDKLSSIMRNTLILMGILIAAGMPFFKLLGWSIRPGLFMMCTILSITLIMLILTQRHDHNNYPWYRRIFLFVLIIGIGLFVGFKMFKTHKPPSVSISENQITISGSYGLTTLINKIELIESIPKIIRRTGGYADGTVRKGNFLLQDWGTCKLFIQSSGGPYIKISTVEWPIIINGSSADNTKKLYQELIAEK